MENKGGQKVMSEEDITSLAKRLKELDQKYPLDPEIRKKLWDFKNPLLIPSKEDWAHIEEHRKNTKNYSEEIRKLMEETNE
jgi:RNAse (barnase) inhibitor barstar